MDEKKKRDLERKRREELLDYDLMLLKKEGKLIEDEFSFCTTGASSLSLDNYVIGKRIGQGAYATVRVGM